MAQAQRLAQSGAAAGAVPEAFVRDTVLPSIFSLWDDNKLAAFVRATFHTAPEADVSAFLQRLLERKHDDDGIGAYFAQPPHAQAQHVQVLHQKRVPSQHQQQQQQKGRKNGGNKKAAQKPRSTRGKDGPAAAYEAVDAGKVVFSPPKDDQGFVQVVQTERYCGCMGTQHRALTNCLNCGKVACAKEGYGPCTYCGAMVAPRKGKAAAAAAKKQQGDAAAEDEERALRLQKNLLEFDRTAAQRTVIYDDQEDYFSTSEWLSPEERQRQQEEANRREEEKQFVSTKKVTNKHTTSSHATLA